MNKAWQNFLASEGILPKEISANATSDSGQSLDSPDASCRLHPLTTYGLLKISGPEASSFLQAQFTNDVAQVTGSIGQLNAYCSPKGRVIALFSMVKHADAFYLIVPTEVLPAFHQRLKMFVLMAKVTLEDYSDQHACFGISGARAETALQTAELKIPAEHYHTEVNNHLLIQKLPAIRGEYRFEIIGPPDHLIPLWEKLSSTSIKSTETLWQRDTILTGIPTVTTDIVDTFIPQMLNLDLIDAVSFTKGCYPGQETVARTRHLGKLKRRTFLLQIDTAHAPAIGSKIEDDDENTLGQVINVSAHTPDSCVALAVLNLDAADAKSLQLADANKTPASLMTMPYDLPQ